MGMNLGGNCHQVGNNWVRIDLEWKLTECRNTGVEYDSVGFDPMRIDLIPMMI